MRYKLISWFIVGNPGIPQKKGKKNLLRSEKLCIFLIFLKETFATLSLIVLPHDFFCKYNKDKLDILTGIDIILALLIDARGFL